MTDRPTWPPEVRRQQAMAQAAKTRNRELVLRYPDLAKRLCDPPLKATSPETWSGFVPGRWLPEDEDGRMRPNTSPIRAQLLAILTEAADRADQDTRPAPAP